MIGITLLPEQIRAAPPEIRRWLEAEIAATFAPAGVSAAGAPYAGTPHGGGPTRDGETRRLVACDLETARAILSLIQGMLPVVSVFFELGRDPIAVSAEGLRVLRLDQMMQHAHLRALEQLVACLRAIDAADERVRGEPGTVLTVLDDSGHCLVAEETGRNIFTPWQEIVATHELAHAAAPAFSSPYAISVPPLATPGGATPGGETPGGARMGGARMGGVNLGGMAPGG